MTKTVLRIGDTGKLPGEPDLTPALDGKAPDRFYTFNLLTAPGHGVFHHNESREGS